MKERFCVICGKPLTGGQRKLCSEGCRKEKKRKQQREWIQNNPEKKKECSLKWRQNNLEKIKEYDHEYYQNNLERLRENSRDYYRNNREKVLEYDRKYRQNNPEKIKEKNRVYRQEHKDERNEYDHKWRQNNPDYMHEWRQNNPDYDREYYWNNRERSLDGNRRRYRLSRGLPEDIDLHEESSIEIIMKEWLRDNNIKFEQEFGINLQNSTWTRVDFYIPEANICLYCDGDYWHSLLEVQKRDIKQNEILSQMGYNVVRLTETEILEGVCINV